MKDERRKTEDERREQQREGGRHRGGQVGHRVQFSNGGQSYSERKGTQM
jgi:hypothetical protein